MSLYTIAMLYTNYNNNYTVCVSVCQCVYVCVVLNEISAENPLDKSEALYLQELLGMRV